MISNIFLGAIGKLIANIVTSFFDNQRHKDDLIASRDDKILEAQTKIAEAANKDWLGKLSRTIIFILLVSTYCYIAIQCLEMLDKNIVVPVDIRPGLLSRFVNKPVSTTIIISHGVILQYFQETISVVLRFFAVASRKR